MTVIEYLIASAERYPEKTAFSDIEKGITYQELLEKTKRIGTFLIRRIRKEKEAVVVLIDRNVESICAFLGVAMSRNFYVPVDVSQPQQRVRSILEQMRPVAVVAAASVPEDFPLWEEVPVFHLQELLAEKPEESLLQEVHSRCLDTDPLYAICTSGSTGIPKGVLICHRSVLDFIPVFCRTFSFQDTDRFGNQAPFDFDVSVKDIYSTLYCGASMYILPKVCFTMPKYLVRVLDEQKITVIIWAVSALCIPAGMRAFQKLVPRYLKKILFSGEVMPVKMLNIWRAYYPEALFVNLYGPTEITCNCMYYLVEREFMPTEKLPLGIPFSNEEVLVLKEDGSRVQPGEAGEICVLGSCLALGYYRDPEKTAKAFVQNPENDRYPERMYRTGDLAVLAEDGQYYYMARKDFQIKHMGHRIELEEIETFLHGIREVERACCLFDKEKNKIVACYLGEIGQRELVLQLKKVLPKYMIPNLFFRLKALPISKNGKIDRQLLMEEYKKGRLEEEQEQ